MMYILSSALPLVCITANHFTYCYQGGVQRVHLLDGTIGGVLLLELFKRDGMGTMVARYTCSNFFISFSYKCNCF